MTSSTCTLYSLTYLQERCSVHVQDLYSLIAARDLAHVLNISPVREKRMTNSNDTKKVVYSLQHSTEDVNVSFGQIFLYIAYIHLTSEKMSVIYLSVEKGLVTTECFLGCAKEAILI